MIIGTAFLIIDYLIAMSNITPFSHKKGQILPVVSILICSFGLISHIKHKKPCNNDFKPYNYGLSIGKSEDHAHSVSLKDRSYGHIFGDY